MTNKRTVEQNDFSSSSALCDAVRSKLRLALPLSDDDVTVVRKSFDARRVRGEHRCCWNYVVDVRERALLAARPRKKLDPLSGQLERCSAAHLCRLHMNNAVSACAQPSTLVRPGRLDVQAGSRPQPRSQGPADTGRAGGPARVRGVQRDPVVIVGRYGLRSPALRG